ncbi:MAG: PPOX class F420-dependent oxidoreductase [Segniliparus sp.]|uniref:PPOX class F420-dependent oxidoreductase n=1 Tax=Segniliparus sp. TaxID=2804064 RepID=UPI003F31163B
MASLQDPQVRDFLSSGPKIGQLGYLGKDGRPLVVPIWFIVRDDALVISTAADSVKAKALQRDPRVVLTADVDTIPYAYVQVQGLAEVDTNSPQSGETFLEIAKRYLAEDEVAGFVEKYGSVDLALVTIRPTKIVPVFET